MCVVFFVFSFSRALDLIFIMSYDFHELNRTSINAPLNRENGQDPNTETIAENLNIFLEQGCEPEKLIMGIPTYGRTYTLKDPNENYVGAFVDGLGVCFSFLFEFCTRSCSCLYDFLWDFLFLLFLLCCTIYRTLVHTQCPMDH